MGEPHLPERVVTLLVSSEYARLVGRTMSERLEYIVDIASLHTRDELVRRLGLGRVVVRQVEKWLAFHGRRLRHPNESIDIAMCGLEFRKRRIRRSRVAVRSRRLNSKTIPREPGRGS
ncbi:MULTISPECIES: hypothetical protein [unclassified Bradyrhizobium]|uniref:hypothetical protein n=1 Tax=unclassified Bradyrhizobium TaxID=2631580 RepID=UPI0028E84310|nr:MULTISPECIES: hypothetical protein [unclassified Bradyrhizobium]